MAGEKKKEQNGPSMHGPDELVKSLAQDPAQPPDVVSYVGFLGESTRDGYQRLYFSVNLNEYVEFSKADVVASRQLPAPQTPFGLGGTLVWFKREAKLLHSRTQPIQAQGSFLAGDISANFLRSNAGPMPASSGAAGPMAAGYPTVGWCTLFCSYNCSWGCTWRCTWGYCDTFICPTWDRFCFTQG